MVMVALLCISPLYDLSTLRSCYLPPAVAQQPTQVWFTLNTCTWPCQIAPCCWSSLRVCIRGKSRTILHVEQINIMTQNEGGELCVQTAGGPSTNPPASFRHHGKTNASNLNNKQPFLLHILQLQKDISAPGALSEKILCGSKKLGLAVRLPFNKLGKVNEQKLLFIFFPCHKIYTKHSSFVPRVPCFPRSVYLLHWLSRVTEL